MDEIRSRFELQYDEATHRRLIAGKEIILHCHHYNSRLQHTIEGASRIDGKAIVRTSAESVFSDHVARTFTAADAPDARWAVARELYAHLGFGDLDVSRVASGVVEATASHYVEGWNAGFPGRSEPVCTVTEGYLAGAHHAVTGESVAYRETACMITGAERCRFELSREARAAIAPVSKRPTSFRPKPKSQFARPAHIDEDTIISALVAMPIHGDAQGLIPAFGVYLASMPADFYNLISIRFIEEMDKVGLRRNASELLVADAENCGMNTFRGIVSSPEWAGLVGPMLRDLPDTLYGIVAVSNALGWGNWYITLHDPGATLRIEALNGYEAVGYLELRGTSQEPQCLMLRGVAAGVMALVYGQGSVQERFGSFASEESSCICREHASCVFEVQKA